MKKQEYQLSVTTQGPLYPPSEIMDEKGNFVVIGYINKKEPGSSKIVSKWGGAIVSTSSVTPQLGDTREYDIVKEFNPLDIDQNVDRVLWTLPYPIPNCNYDMNFCPQQKPYTSKRDSYPLHLAPIPDARNIDGRKIKKPIMLSEWLKASGKLKLEEVSSSKEVNFTVECSGLIPNALYTVMVLRQNDLNPELKTRPGVLGIPNVFITNQLGEGYHQATLTDPFNDKNRIINVIVLFMSSQMSYGGAIGHFGLGGDIHAVLKLKKPSFFEF